MSNWDERMHARYGEKWMIVEIVVALVVGGFVGWLVVTIW